MSYLHQLQKQRARLENNTDHPLSALGCRAVCCVVVRGGAQVCAVVLSLQCTKQDTLFRTKWERRVLPPPSDSLTFWKEVELAEGGEAIYLLSPPSTHQHHPSGAAKLKVRAARPAACKHRAFHCSLSLK